MLVLFSGNCVGSFLIMVVSCGLCDFLVVRYFIG